MPEQLRSPANVISGLLNDEFACRFSHKFSLSPYFRPLLAPVISTKPLLFALMATMCFMGAFAGFLIPNYYRAYMGRTAVDGAYYGVVNILYVPSIVLGATLPPLLLLLSAGAACRALRAMRSRMNTPVAHQQNNTNDLEAALEHRSSGTESSVDFPTAPVAFTPSDASGYYKLRSTITGNCVDIMSKRPDVKAFLENVKADNDEEIQIQVLVGGPSALVEMVQENVHRLNNSNRLGLGGEGPYMFFRKVTFL